MKTAIEQKDLGRIGWREAVKRGLIAKTLLLDRVPDNSPVNTPVEVEVTSSKLNARATVVLDTDFFKEKAIRHYANFFPTLDDALDFLKTVWEERGVVTLKQKANIDDLTEEEQKLLLELLQKKVKKA